jgi:hypothetical protein
VTSVLTVVGIEHVVIAIVLVFKFCYDRDPVWLQVFSQRKTHKELKRQKIAYD